MAFGFPAYHTESYSPSESGSDLRTAVTTTLDALSWSITKESPDTIIASNRLNIRSWGEEVIVTFLPDNTISVTSRCALRTQCFDWGKNKANINKFMAELRNHI